MKAYIAKEKKDKSGFTAFQMVDCMDRETPIAFYPTDCRTFKTFDEANMATEYMANKSGIPFVNMR